MGMCLYVYGVPHAHRTGGTGGVNHPTWVLKLNLNSGPLQEGGRVSHPSTLFSQEHFRMYQ